MLYIWVLRYVTYGWETRFVKFLLPSFANWMFLKAEIVLQLRRKCNSFFLTNLSSLQHWISNWSYVWQTCVCFILRFGSPVSLEDNSFCTNASGQWSLDVDPNPSVICFILSHFYEFQLFFRYNYSNIHSSCALRTTKACRWIFNNRMVSCSHVSCNHNSCSIWRCFPSRSCWKLLFHRCLLTTLQLCIGEDSSKQADSVTFPCNVIWIVELLASKYCVWYKNCYKIMVMCPLLCVTCHVIHAKAHLLSNRVRFYCLAWYC